MESTWVATAKAPAAYPRLERDIETDVAVVGSGLTDITLVYLLSKSGKRVALLTKKTAAESASAYTTGFLSAEIDTSLENLVKMFGREKARAVWEAGKRAIDRIEETIRAEDIRCEFVRCSSYTYAKDDSEWGSLQRESALARELGFDVVASRDTKLPFKNAGGMEFRNQAKFHALKYGYALKERAKEQGALMFDNSEAIKIEREASKLRVSTEKGSVFARDVVLATYYPFTKPRQLFAHTGEYTTYILEYAYKGSLPEAMYQDMHNPYHYFRIDALNSRLIVGGEDHRVEFPIDPEKNFDALKRYTTDIFPDISMRETRRWKGGIIEPLDGLPFIGALKSDANQYVATGFSGFGMTMSRVVSEIIADEIMLKKNEFAGLFSPSRLPTPYQLAKKGVDYVGEFFGGAMKNVFK